MQHKSLFVSLIPHGNVASLLQDEQSSLCKHFGTSAIYPLFCPIALLTQKNEIASSSATMTQQNVIIGRRPDNLFDTEIVASSATMTASSILSEYKNFFQSKERAQSFTLSNLIMQDGAFYRTLNFQGQNNLQSFKNCALSKILQLKKNAFCYCIDKKNLHVQNRVQNILQNKNAFTCKDISFAVCRLALMQVELDEHNGQFDTQWHIIEESWLNLRKN